MAETEKQPNEQQEAQPSEPVNTAPEEAPAPNTEPAAAKTKLEKMEKELADAKERLLRTAAEYDNFRKRSAKEHDAAFDNGVSFCVGALLPVLDTLELAANAPTADESYKKGVLMTLTKCKEAFDKMGVCEIEAQGKPFDPALHAAVMQQPADESVESGTILQVMQKGYTLHDKVVRFATVVVAE